MTHPYKPYRTKKYRSKKRCEDAGKVRYRNENDAINALSSLKSYQNKGEEKRQEKRIYECPKCSGWHLTSQDAFNSARLEQALKGFKLS